MAAAELGRRLRAEDGNAAMTAQLLLMLQRDSYPTRVVCRRL
jgi:hypothetical protein